MYGIKESDVRAMSAEMILARQRLFDEVLPNWENRIFKLAVMTYPKVDQRLLGLDDLQQELRLALWGAILSFDVSKGAEVTTWVCKIINQASRLVAKMQYHKMPHIRREYLLVPSGALPCYGEYDKNDDACLSCEYRAECLRRTRGDVHGAQLLSLRDNTTVVPNDEESESYEILVGDPDSIGRIEAGLEKEECIKAIRPALREGFEQDVFDLFMEGLTGGDIVRELGMDPKKGAAARVSSVRLKIKIAYAIVHCIPLGNVSSAKNTEYLAGRMRHLLSSKKGEEEAEELPPPNMYPQFA